MGTRSIPFTSEIADDIARGVGESIRAAVLPLRKRIAVLEDRLIGRELSEVQRWLTARDGFGLVVRDRLARRAGEDPPKTDELQRAEIFYRSLADRLRLLTRDALEADATDEASRAARLLHAAMQSENGQGGGAIGVARQMQAIGVRVPVKLDDNHESASTLMARRDDLDQQVDSTLQAIDKSADDPAALLRHCSDYYNKVTERRATAAAVRSLRG